MKKILFLSVFLIVILSGIISATISSIDYPYDGEILTSPSIDLQISTTGATTCYWNYNGVHNYTLSGCEGDKIRLPNSEGNYNITITDQTGDYKNVEVNLDYPNGFIIIFFSGLFIILCFEMLGLLLWTLLSFIELNIDAKDLILNISSYFALWAFYILGLDYYGNTFVSNFSLFLIEIGAVTMVIIPIIGFVVSFIKQNTTKGDHN